MPGRSIFLGEAMADNVQHKIARNRPPRVQITYDVEIGNAIEKQEIPFVVGIMADLSGFGEGERPDGVALKDKARSFIEIDRDNFGEVMNKIAPSLAIQGALDGDDEDAGGNLVFRSLDDFLPNHLVQRVKDIRDLQVRRSALRDVLTKLDSNDELYKQLKVRARDGTLDDVGKAANTRLLAIGGPDDPGLDSAETETKAADQPAKKPVAGKGEGGEIAGADKK